MKCGRLLCDMTEEDVTMQPPFVRCGPKPRPWYYDNDMGKCVRFTHSGCEKRLPFAKKRECERKCKY